MSADLFKLIYIYICNFFKFPAISTLALTLELLSLISNPGLVSHCNSSRDSPPLPLPEPRDSEPGLWLETVWSLVTEGATSGWSVECQCRGGVQAAKRSTSSNIPKFGWVVISFLFRKVSLAPRFGSISGFTHTVIPHNVNVWFNCKERSYVPWRIQVNQLNYFQIISSTIIQTFKRTL